MDFSERKSKALFLVALASSGLTQSKLAQRLGCDQSMISLILSGERNSDRIEKELSRFIRDQLKRLKIMLTKDEIASENRAAAISANRNGKSAKRLAKAFKK